MKQDCNLTLAIIDAVLERLKVIRPDVTTLNFQSDNAKCYQGNFFIEVLICICKNRNYRLKSYVHSETQDGKCSIDGHFAVGMRVVNNRVNEGFNASTPEELAQALISNGGIRNTDVILLKNNRVVIEELFTKCSKFKLKRWGEYSEEVNNS
jgi:hypothetical protein